MLDINTTSKELTDRIRTYLSSRLKQLLLAEIGTMTEGKSGEMCTVSTATLT